MSEPTPSTLNFKPDATGNYRPRFLSAYQIRMRTLNYSDKHIQSCVDQLEPSLERGLGVCESPIEAEILPWLCVGHYLKGFHKPALVHLPDQDDLPPENGVFIVPQLKFGRYRLDFAVVARSSAKSIIVAVECDGFEFHDVRRDRRRDAYLAAFRIPTVRIQGREVYKTPEFAWQDVAAIVQAWEAQK